MGGPQDKPQEPPAVPQQKKSLQEERLNTKDLENALDTVFSWGRPRGEDGTFKLFNCIVDMGRTVMNPIQSNKEFQNFMHSDVGQTVTKQVMRYLDTDGDGRVTARDFQIMYDRDLKKMLRQNESTLNALLPFLGQCFFGLAAGFAVGRVAYRLYEKKVLIIISSVVLYSGVQYMAQMNFVNQNTLEAAFRKKVRNLADVNGDGEINKEDVNFLIQNRMQYIATKLGPGGIAPGMVGYGTLALGILRGLRKI